MAGNAICHPHIVRAISHPSALRTLAAGDFGGRRGCGALKRQKKGRTMRGMMYTCRVRRLRFWTMCLVNSNGRIAFNEIRAADDMAVNAIVHPQIVRDIRHPSALRQWAEVDFDGLR